MFFLVPARRRSSSTTAVGRVIGGKLGANGQSPLPTASTSKQSNLCATLLHEHGASEQARERREKHGTAVNKAKRPPGASRRHRSTPTASNDRIHSSLNTALCKIHTQQEVQLRRTKRTRKRSTQQPTAAEATVGASEEDQARLFDTLPTNTQHKVLEEKRPRRDEL